MTHIYFVRHAEPDFSVHDDACRPLTEKGIEDAKRVQAFFSCIPVDAFYSSPYRRSIDTIKGAADFHGKTIITDSDFRERAVSGEWIDDFNSFAQRQWSDFDFRLPNGESLRETETRNIRALSAVYAKHEGQTVVIGSHGTAISTIIRHYDPSFGYSDFKSIQSIMPFVVLFTFQKDRLAGYRFVSI